MYSSDEGRWSRSSTPPASLTVPISPPSSFNRPASASTYTIQRRENDQPDAPEAPVRKLLPPNAAAIEAGETQIRDHLEYFSMHLGKALKPGHPQTAISIDAFRNLYLRNCHSNPHGRHFVVHQHDHPVAGLHYDLRLQISETSSISFAIMYGLPGNPNSSRPNRNATETRVHNVWNHLIETASSTTGSLMIWDTGEYSVLSYHDRQRSTDSEDSCLSNNDHRSKKFSDNEKLRHAFQSRKICVRFHGKRLPAGYTLSIRLPTSENRHEQPRRPVRKRRKQASTTSIAQEELTSLSSTEAGKSSSKDLEAFFGTATAFQPSTRSYKHETAEDEDEKVRRTNAYLGANNSIRSVYQRKWYLSLNRHESGFELKIRSDGSKKWVRREEDGRLLGFEPFSVRGMEHEKSIITGRRADEILTDEGVEGYVSRKGWNAVLE